MSRPILAAVLALLATVAGGCRPDAVRVAFRPEPGARYVYRIEVDAVAVTTVGSEPPRRTVADDVFEADHAVLATGRRTSTVQVRLRPPEGRPVTFVVRLDRAAQLTEVQRVEGLPASVLGELGLSEIFPPAAAAPPDRPLSPGQRWRVDVPVQLSSPDRSRLVGEGRLVGLGVVEGRDVATVATAYRLPVRRSTGEGGARLLLDGSMATRARGTYALSDGAVVSTTATTTGRYRLTVYPPEGTAGAPLSGTLDVEVHSKTRRLR